MNKFIRIFNKMLYILDRPQKILCIMVFIMTCVGSILECLGVSVIIPVVNVILTPEEIMKSKIVQSIPWLQNLDTNELIIFIIGSVILIYILKNVFFVCLSWVRIKFSCKIQREIAILMMESYMSRGYQFFLKKDFGELNRGVVRDTETINTVLYAGFRLLSDALTIVLLCIFMCVTDISLSMAMIAVSLICILFIYFVFRKRMVSAGKQYWEYHAKAGQAIMQAFHGIKDVLILRKQEYFVETYEKNQIRVQHAQCKQTMGAESPTYIIEGFCVTGLLAMVAFKILTGSEQSTEFIASLAAFALAAFRILPSLGKISISLNQLLSSIPSVDSVYENLREANSYSEQHPELKLRRNKSVSEENTDIAAENHFNSKLELKNISFRYNDDAENVIQDLDLTISKGQAIALIGPSGAGKSTLVDILLGLLVPQKGHIFVDGMRINEQPELWAKMIGYVPQTVFLSSGSILENVAFGEHIERIDEDAVWEALRKAELEKFVRELPEGLNTLVGDRGVRLSGGQRQRIAIARALYHNPEILVLDEATSALDNNTEEAIISAIDSLQGKVTMIIVAHRLTTVKNCDVIYEVKNKTITKKEKREIFGV